MLPVFWQPIRLLLELTAHYNLPVIAYTISFGILLVAGLLLIILGFEVLEAPAVVIISTLIPLSLATGLVWEYLPSFRAIYLVFALIGLVAIIVTRSFPMPGKLPTIVLALTHGVAGMTIFLLPIIFAISGQDRTRVCICWYWRSINRCRWPAACIPQIRQTNPVAKNYPDSSSRFVIVDDSLLCDRFQGRMMVHSGTYYFHC